MNLHRRRIGDAKRGRFSDFVGRADKGEASPIVALSSLSTMEQHVQVQCLGKRGVQFSKSVWYVSNPNAGRGRILESNPGTAMARNFSCGFVAELCEADFFGVNYIPASQTVEFGQIETQICENNCSGTPLGPGDDGYSYSWSSGGPSIARISGSSSDQSVEVYGASTSGTYIYGSASDGFCYQSVAPPPPVDVIGISQSPSTINMSSGDTTVYLTVSTSPASIALNTGISHGLTSNPNSASNAAISFTAPKNFTGLDNWLIAASGSNSPSGIFNATTCADGIRRRGMTQTDDPLNWALVSRAIYAAVKLL